jgi:DNA-directed RNA polymerase subunit RPC12/RpoP
MRCSRCKKQLENGIEVKFARMGNYMGKPLCRKCRAEVEEEAEERYREGRVKAGEYPESVRKLYKI